MKNRIVSFFFVTWLVVFAGGELRGQTPNNPNQGNQSVVRQEDMTDSLRKDKLWTANLSRGSYMVRLSAIQSISRHQYVLDGSILVDEVTVDAVGQSLARFYFIEPITEEMGGSEAANVASNVARRGRQMMDRASGRAGLDLDDMVVKKYPDTTHARTVEFRLTSEKELSGLFSSVQKAWTSGRGRAFVIK